MPPARKDGWEVQVGSRLGRRGPLLPAFDRMQDAQVPAPKRTTPDASPLPVFGLVDSLSLSGSIGGNDSLGGWDYSAYGDYVQVDVSWGASLTTPLPDTRPTAVVSFLIDGTPYTSAPMVSSVGTSQALQRSSLVLPSTGLGVAGTGITLCLQLPGSGGPDGASGAGSWGATLSIYALEAP